MDINEKNLKKLEKLFSLMDTDSLSKEDFVKHFETVIKIIENLKRTNEKEFELIHENFNLMSEKMKNENSGDVAENKKEMMDYCYAEMAKMYKEHETMIKMIDKKMNKIPTVEEIKSQIKIPTVEEIEKDLPKLGAEIRDSLELLQGDERVDISAIKGLMEKLEEIKQINASKKVFGASVIHKFIDDETPTGAVNGINKDFVLSKSPLGLKVYKGGARQRITEDYTLSNKTITFITAPVAGEIILCDYRHY